MLDANGNEDPRARATTTKSIDPVRLDATLGGHGVGTSPAPATWVEGEEVTVVAEQPVTQAELEAALAEYEPGDLERAFAWLELERRITHPEVV